MSKWSEQFNKLPKEVRHIGAMCEAETRIQHLNFEKKRLKARYAQSIREINEHIANCEKWLRNEGM